MEENENPSLYLLLKRGSIDLIEAFIKDMDESKLEAELSKNLEYLRLLRVPLEKETETFAQEKLFCLRFQQETSHKQKKPPNQKDVEMRRKFLFNLITEVRQYENREVDDILLLKLEYIAQSMYMLKQNGIKKQLKPMYRKLPFNEVEFIVTLYLCFLRNEDIGFMVPFDLNFLLKYLNPFKENMQIETAAIEEIKNEFRLIRSIYSVSRINKYIELVKDIDLDNNEDIGRCVIERAIQVTGEYLKKSEGSPNITKELEGRFEEIAPTFLKSVTSLRDILSHNEIKRPEMDMPLCKDIKKELEKVQPKIVNILFVEQYMLYEETFKQNSAMTISAKSISKIGNRYADNYVSTELLKFIIYNCQEEIKHRILTHYFKNMSEYTAFVRLFEILENTYDSGKIRDSMLAGAENNELLQIVFKSVTEKTFKPNTLKQLQETLQTAKENPKEIIQDDDDDSGNITNISDVHDRLNKMEIQNLGIEKLLEDKCIEAAVEFLALHLLESYDIGLNNTVDVYYPLLMGQSLRNYLAHHNLIHASLPNTQCEYFSINALNNKDSLKFASKINLRQYEIVPFDNKYKDCLSKVELQNNFFVACKDKDIEEVKTWVEKGADIDGMTYFGWNALDFAVERDYEDMFDYFQDKIKYDMRQLLYIAIRNDSKQIFEKLLKRCKDEVSKDGTYLQIAICNNRQYMIKELVTCGVNLNTSIINGLPPLHLAVLLSQEDIVKLLLGAGANINIEDRKGNKALHVAALMGYDQLINLLLNKGAEKNSINAIKRTPLHYASANGHLNAVEVLLKMEANTNQRDESGKTPLHLTAEFGQLDVLKLLFDKNADIDAITKVKDSILHLSARNGHINIVKHILENNYVSVNIKDYDGNSALHLAIRHKRTEVVKYLLECGAAVNSPNNYGQFALDVASNFSNEDIYKMLEENGAKLKFDVYHVAEKLKRYLLGAVHIEQDPSIEKFMPIIQSMKEEYVINDQMVLLPFLDDNEKKSLLHNAAFYGRTDIIRNIHQAEVTFSHEDIIDALNLAALNGHIDVMNTIIESLEESEKLLASNAASLFHYAAVNSNDHVIDLLFKHGLDINSQNPNGLTALHFITNLGDISGIKTLLKYKPSLDVKEKSGFYVIQYAIFFKHSLDTIQLLIDNGSDIEIDINQENASILHFAVASKNNLDLIRMLIDKGANIHAKDKDDLTLLHYAVQCKDNLKVINFLVDEGLDVHAIDRGDATTLHYAVQRKDNVEVIKYLIDRGVNINARDDDDATALYYAVQKKDNISVINLLIENGADITIIHGNGQTLMHSAVQCKDNLEVLKFLLNKGENIHARDATNRTPLHYAVKSADNLNVVNFLLNEGADINVTDRYNATLLHTAVQCKSNLNVINYLRDRGLDINAKDMFNGTLLHYAVQCKDNIEVIDWLLNKGGDIDAKDAFNGTLLQCAVQHYNNLNVINFLIDKGADVNTKDVFKASLLHLAVRCKDNLDVVKLLVDKGADILAKEVNNRTAMHYAVQTKNNLSVINFLLNKGVNIDVLDANNSTPLYCAVQIKDNMKVINFLIDKGADIDAKNIFDETLLHSAVRCDGNISVISHLLDKGADINAKNINGKTPLHYAVEIIDNLITINFLIEKGANIHLNDNRNGTLLHSAVCCKDNVNVITFLINKGYDINGADVSNKTPLHYAVQIKDNIKVIHFLIENGANMLALCDNDETLLHSAVKCNDNINVIRFLLYKGADFNAKDRYKRTLLHSAVQRKDNLNVINFLIDNGADITALDINKASILHSAVMCKDNLKVIDFLLEKGADINAKDANNLTVLHYASKSEDNLNVISFLINMGAKDLTQD